MSTLDEIEAAMDKLPPPQQERLLRFLTSRLGNSGVAAPPIAPCTGLNVLDIAPASVGKASDLKGGADDDLLGEMSEGRA